MLERPRHNRLVIPLREDERKTIDRWAETEKLPTATAARRVLLLTAEALIRADCATPRAKQAEQGRA